MSNAAPYTLRKSGSSDRKILTFRKIFFEKVLAIHPWAWAVFWTRLTKEIKAISGKTIVLDYDQDQCIEKKYVLKSFNFNLEQRLITDCIADHFRINDCQEAIEVLDGFAKKYIPDNGT